MAEFDTRTPSVAVDFLRQSIGKSITSLVRYSWWTDKEAADVCAVPDHLVFSLTAGPLAVFLDDGTVIGIASDPALNSIVVWDESLRTSLNRFETLENDDELFAISDDGKFASQAWRTFHGLSISGFSIIKHISMNAKQRSLPSEVGLRFIFSNNMSFIASHGLQDNSDDFAVLEQSQLELDGLDEYRLI